LTLATIDTTKIQQYLFALKTFVKTMLTIATVENKN